jgi:hypothetical protein
MKKLLTLFITALVVISCNSGKTGGSSDLELANLKGKVSQIEKTFHDAGAKCACPAAQKDDCNKSVFTYDEKGNLMESSKIDDNGNTAQLSKYVYNNKGLCKEIQHFSNGNPAGKEVLAFKGCRATGMQIFNESGVLDKSLNYVYKGEELAEEQTVNGEGMVVGTVLNEFENGQLSGQIRKDKDGKVVSVTKFTRNEHKDIVLITLSIPNDNSEYKLEMAYEYDEQGNWTRQTQTYNGEIQNITIRNIFYYNT